MKPEEYYLQLDVQKSLLIYKKGMFWGYIDHELTLS